MGKNQKTSIKKTDLALQDLEFANAGLTWSPKKILATSFICLLITIAAVFGYLYHAERNKAHTAEIPLPFKPSAPDLKNYNNDYWGFKFSYPGSWQALIGSFEEGSYYFSSDKINFTSEMEEGQALLEVNPYIDIKNLGYDPWLEERRQHYFPRGRILALEDFTINGFLATRQFIQLDKPVEGRAFWDLIIVFNNRGRFYQFTLQTKTMEDHSHFTDVFRAILDTLEFYEGYTP